MSDPLERQFLEALDRDGYFVLPGALDRDWVERLRRAFEGAPLQESGTQHVGLTEATPEIASWEALRTHAAVIAAAKHVLGDTFAVTELHGRNPLPGYGQQGLHADAAPRATIEPYLVTTALWMLDDFTAESGATRVVPGSHRVLAPISKSFSQPTATHPSERIVTGEAGSVLVFNGHLWHSGRRNASRGPRRAGQMVVRSARARDDRDDERRRR